MEKKKTGKKIALFCSLCIIAFTVWRLVMCVANGGGKMIGGIYWNVVFYEAAMLLEGYVILWLLSDKKYKKFRKNIHLYEPVEKNVQNA